MKTLILTILLLLPLFPLPLDAAGLPHHDVTVTLDPEKHSLSATDTIMLPKEFPKEFTFALHAGLQPVSGDPGVLIRKKSGQEASVPLELFSVTLPADRTGVTLKYSGTLDHPLIAGKNQARAFDQTPGSIADQGVYLAQTSAWYPLLETDFITFSLTVHLPDAWDCVSQGGRLFREKTKTGIRVGWDSPEPQNEIYLIASRFTAYEKKTDRISAEVYLRDAENGLAQKYLDATIRYIEMYDKLIGPYPYRKFALVENFWETGFGMPSFTLLGPTVLRLPFIINTSYPHEILHNWWGNSVYPVYEKGNWSEGLTAYLADHLLKEQQGGGAEYRLNTLQKYADYVLGGRDFPLTQFTSRHSASTEAVGYGKSLMFFHMLRSELGDQAFVSALRNFYENYKFHFATFTDIEKSFETAVGRSLKPEFDQWVTRAGAPEIRLRDAETGRHGDGYTVKAAIEQVQQGKPYRLRIPVAVTMEGSEKAFQSVIETQAGKKDFEISVPARPLRIDIDPEFDVFRRLDRDEIPPAISQALGAKKMLVILPAAAGKELLKAYRAFADSLSASGPDKVDVKLDSEVKHLPKDSAVTILGWDNRYRGGMLKAGKDYDLEVTREELRISKTRITKENHSVVLTARSPGSRDQALLFIAADRPTSLPGLGRKLPHYHKYSYLAFEGEEPANILKGRWPVVNSPLTAFFRDSSGTLSQIERGKLAPRQVLVSLPPVYSEERMMQTVRFLSDPKLRGREIGTPEIDKAAEYIAAEFRQAGLTPAGDGDGYFQAEKEPARNSTMKNVVAAIPGRKQEFSGQSVVVGAHYDHLGMGNRIGRTADRGVIHPGADDNASGVAVLLELARVLKKTLAPERSIVFVAFTGEEEGRLGSRYYVKNETRFPAAKTTGMVNLDTVGRLDRKKLLVLGGNSAREWVHIFRGAGFVTGVDIDLVSEDLDSSDQISFQEAGIPAVQLFSGPHLDYHRPTDTPDKIDAPGLVKVAAVTKEVVEYLAAREEPLSSSLKQGEKSPPGPKTERRVSLGTIPDFAYQGKGVRLSGVVQDSAAATAGLKEGDVITAINGSTVTGLRQFSDVLRKLNPGDRITVTFARDGREATVRTEVQGR